VGLIPEVALRGVDGRVLVEAAAAVGRRGRVIIMVEVVGKRDRGKGREIQLGRGEDAQWNRNVRMV
jgi:hypothetical protein